MNEIGRPYASILVVDDNPDNLNVLAAFLDRHGFEVLFALDGKSALQRAEFAQPNLILLDVVMPEMDGFETCRRLKALEKTRDIPVIFLSAISDTVDKVQGFELGAVDYITKPIQPEEVLARVKTHITLQNLQNTLKANQQELQAKNAMLADRELHLMKLVEEKTRKIENITLALVKICENANALNDQDTGYHIKRVSAYSAFLAEQYGCDPDFVKRIKLYASLHDVGKVVIPDAILKKPGKYTPEEEQLMQQHVVFGAKLLESEEIDMMAWHIALYHHEKWDGTGYVQGLAGTEIPLEARIAAIADVYDALASERIYKQAFEEEEIDQIITEKSGTTFDPKLVEIFLKNKSHILEIRQALTSLRR